MNEIEAAREQPPSAAPDLGVVMRFSGSMRQHSHAKTGAAREQGFKSLEPSARRISVMVMRFRESSSSIAMNGTGAARGKGL